MFVDPSNPSTLHRTGYGGNVRMLRGSVIRATGVGLFRLAYPDGDVHAPLLHLAACRGAAAMSWEEA